MPRRFIACLVALLFLFMPPAHAAQPGNIADLSALSQWDERFQDEGFRYGTTYFRYGGCGPSSITNGIIAALDITDEDLAAGILHDVLFLLTKSFPTRNRVQLTLLNYLSASRGQLAAADERYPSLNQAVCDFGGTIIYYDGYITTKKLPELLPDAGSGPMVIHGTLSGKDRWPNLRQLIQILTDAGYEDARVALSFLGAGTAQTRSPFRSGTSGHYLTLCFSMADFLRTGEFYVLDSLPRALYGEDYGADETFVTKYDFVGKQTLFSLNDFNALFRVERVKPTIVRVVPTGEARENVLAAQKDGTVPLDALLPSLNAVMQFHGTSHMFISLPER